MNYTEEYQKGIVDTLVKAGMEKSAKDPNWWDQIIAAIIQSLQGGIGGLFGGGQQEQEPRRQPGYEPTYLPVRRGGPLGPSGEEFAQNEAFGADARHRLRSIGEEHANRLARNRETAERARKVFHTEGFKPEPLDASVWDSKGIA